MRPSKRPSIRRRCSMSMRTRLGSTPGRWPGRLQSGGDRCVGSRSYLRFVPAGDAWGVEQKNNIVRETGTWLRLIECEPDTRTWFPDSIQEHVFDFWDAAQQDILDVWMIETDPANLQPKVRPLNLRVAEFMRANGIEKTLYILESPWSRREEVTLRNWFESDQRTSTDASRFFIEQVLGTGLEPVDTPEPLPPISLDDIELVCWLGIEK